MKTIKTILIYTILISIIPLLSLSIIYFYNQKQNVQTSEITTIGDEKYENKSILIKTRNMLINEEFDKLNKYFAQLDKKYIKDISQESLLINSYEAFDIKNKSYKHLFDKWINYSPKNYVPYLARGIFFYNMGWKERGNKWISETKQEQIDKMIDYFDDSKKDLYKSLSLNNNQIYSYSILIGIEITAGMHEKVEYLVEKALKINNNSLLIRLQYIKSLTPRWGGSYEQMGKYIHNTTLDLKTNPKLKYIYGAIYLEQAQTAINNLSYNNADKLLKMAQSLTGKYNYIYQELGRNNLYRENYKEALEQLNKALNKNNENNANAYYYRCKAYIKLDKLKEAFEDIKYASALDPFDENIKNRKEYLSDILRHKAYKLRKNYENQKALNLYNMALVLNPKDDKIHYGLARVYIQKQELQYALDNIKFAIEIAPDDIDHYLLIDYILAKSKDWNQIIHYWNQYIKLKPNDGRAYVERGGAYYHKGDMKEAIKNARTSAELGNLEGKEAYEKFKHLVN